MSINEIYQTSIRPLPAVERLQLASLILDGLASNVGKPTDLGDSWSDQDIADVLAFSHDHAIPSDLSEEF